MDANATTVAVASADVAEMKTNLWHASRFNSVEEKEMEKGRHSSLNSISISALFLFPSTRRILLLLPLLQRPRSVNHSSDRSWRRLSFDKILFDKLKRKNVLYSPCPRPDSRFPFLEHPVPREEVINLHLVSAISSRSQQKTRFGKRCPSRHHFISSATFVALVIAPWGGNMREQRTQFIQTLLTRGINQSVRVLVWAKGRSVGPL